MCQLSVNEPPISRKEESLRLISDLDRVHRAFALRELHERFKVSSSDLATL